MKISKIEICNGKNAYGKIIVNDKEYTFTVVYNNDTLAIIIDVYACPKLVDETALENAYYDALAKKEYVSPAVVKESLMGFWE